MTPYDIALIGFASLADRLRGSGRIPKGLAQAIYGAGVGFYLKQDLLFVIAFTATFILGTAPGWGQPLGAFLGSRPPEIEKAEAWQLGKLPQYPFPSILVRGAIWALPPLTLFFLSHNVWVFSVAMFLAFPLAAIAARLIIGKGHLWGWEAHEYIRGAILGTLLFVLYKQTLPQ